MAQADIRTPWERAVPEWARWDATVAAGMGPATEAMLVMAGVDLGARGLDLVSGARSQTLQAARQVESHGHVAASDMAEMMRHQVRE